MTYGSSISVIPGSILKPRKASSLTHGFDANSTFETLIVGSCLSFSWVFTSINIFSSATATDNYKGINFKVSVLGGKRVRLTKQKIY